MVYFPEECSCKSWGGVVLSVRVQEVTIRGGGLKHVACAEDEDFIQALDKMMLENLQVASLPVRGYFALH